MSIHEIKMLPPMTTPTAILARAYSGWHRDAQFIVPVDNGRDVLSYLPANLNVIGRLHHKGRLHAPAPPPQSGQKGWTREW